MKSIKLINIKKNYNGEEILNNLNLTIPSGQFFALLGPSGSGKTTILRLIAGFEEVDNGQIFLDNENITYVPINQRKINTVFQNYALFPHLNVFDNVAYGPRLKGLPENIIEQKVIKILRAIHLESHIYKSIDQLSGGQKQRVALARAIVNEPDVLLLDEPLTALDPKLRERLLIELIDLQATLKTTFVYVTHDHFEALTVADKMAILNNDGDIEQIGTPKEIYEFPVSSFVAKFVGTTNLLHGTLDRKDGQAIINIPQLHEIQVNILDEHKFKIGSQVMLSIRPEKIFISKKEVSGFSNHLCAIVQSIVYHGRSTQYNLELADGKIVSVFEQNEEHFSKEVIDYEDRVNIYWQKENAIMLER